MKIWKMAVTMFSGMLLVSSLALAQQPSSSGVIYTSITAVELAKILLQRPKGSVRKFQRIKMVIQPSLLLTRA